MKNLFYGDLLSDFFSERYRDLINAADTIQDMKTATDEVG